MTIIHNMDVALGARTAAYDAKMRASAATTTAFGAAAQVAGAQLKMFGLSLLAGGVGLIGITSILRALGNAADEIDRLQKLAGTIGSTAAELQTLELQAQLTGVSKEKLGKALQVLNRRLGETIQGSKESKKALDILKLSADDLANKPLSEAMGDISEAINQLGTDAEKAAVANQLFGRSGVDLINFFRGGRQGIQEASDFLDKFNLKLDDIGAAGVERMNDAWLKTKMIIDGIAMKSLTQVGFAMEGILESIQKMLMPLSQLSSEMGLLSDIFTSINVNMAVLAATMAEMQPANMAITAADMINGGEGFAGVLRRINEAGANALAKQLSRTAQAANSRRFGAGGAGADGSGSGSRLMNSAAIGMGTQEEFKILFGRSIKEQNKELEELKKINKNGEEQNDNLEELIDELSSAPRIARIESFG